MEANKGENEKPGIVFSCYHRKSRDGEHFVPEHTLSFSISGDLILNDGSKEYVSTPGSLRLIRRNNLMKFIKCPPRDGEFKSISIYLDQQSLRNFSNENGLSPDKKNQGTPVIDVKSNKQLKDYCISLADYEQAGNLLNHQMVTLKIKEGLLLLLQSNPELKNVLFDFADPFKIDLEAFMNKNYHFNVHLERFAYLTGRSLAAFKRDFEKIFGTTPGRWLQQKRLKEAHYLIAEKGKKASHVYLDLGFENLSHFSYAYKKKYGVGPSLSDQIKLPQ